VALEAKRADVGRAEQFRVAATVWLVACGAALLESRLVQVLLLMLFGLVGVARQGRSLIYAARYETMTSLLAYLTENCCAGKTELCAPAVCSPPKPTRKRTKETVR